MVCMGEDQCTQYLLLLHLFLGALLSNLLPQVVYEFKGNGAVDAKDGNSVSGKVKIQPAPTDSGKTFLFCLQCDSHLQTEWLGAVYSRQAGCRRYLPAVKTLQLGLGHAGERVAD